MDNMSLRGECSSRRSNLRLNGSFSSTSRSRLTGDCFGQNNIALATTYESEITNSQTTWPPESEWSMQRLANPGSTMTIPLYSQIPWNEPIFDGNTARKYLEKHLAMFLVKLSERPDLLQEFEIWYQQNQKSIIVQKDIYILIPPEWY